VRGLFKKLTLVLFFILVIFVLIVLGISVKAVDTLTKVKRVPITQTPKDVGLTFENVKFKSAVDGLTLKGWFIPSNNSDKVVVLIHGTAKNRQDSDVGFLEIAKGLIKAGFSVLTFDLRAHGESEGQRYTLGFHERRDVEGAISYLENRGIKQDKIGLMGFSLGGELAILASEDFPQIGAVISDSSFTNFSETLKDRLPKESKLPPFFVYPVTLVAKILLGIDITQLNPEAAIAKMPNRRFLIIHGEADDIFPKENALRLAKASKNPATEVWVVPGAKHTQAFNTEPGLYILKVTEFLKQELLD